MLFLNPCPHATKIWSCRWSGVLQIYWSKFSERESERSCEYRLKEGPTHFTVVFIFPLCGREWRPSYSWPSPYTCSVRAECCFISVGAYWIFWLVWGRVKPWAWGTGYIEMGWGVVTFRGGGRGITMRGFGFNLLEGNLKPVTTGPSMGVSQNWNLISKSYFSSLSLKFYPQSTYHFQTVAGPNPC